MNFLPVVEHELRLAVRRRLSNHRIRVICSAAPIVIALWLILVWSAWTPTASFGRQFLGALSVVGYLGSLLAGVLLGADSLSRERREQTLRLLFLTSLSSRDILFGKLTAKMVLAFYALLATIPVLALSVVLGGISVRQCICLFVVWLGTVFLSLSVSLLVSSLCTQQRSAQVGAAAILLALAGAIPLLGMGLTTATANGVWRQLSLVFSPSGLFAFANRQPSATGWFWAAFVMNQVVALAALVLANRVLLRAQTDPRAELGKEGGAASLSSADLEDRRRDRARLLEGRPLEWLACRAAGSPLSRWIWPMIALAVFLAGPLDPSGNRRSMAIFLLFLLAQIAFKLVVAIHASYAFASDRRTGALESLLGTPVEVGEIASGMFRGFVQRFLKPLLLLTALGLMEILLLLWNGADQSALLHAAAVILLLADVYAAFWVGLFAGLAARNPGLGLMGTVLRILILPGVWFVATWQIFWQSSLIELLILGGVLAAVNHLVFVVNSRGRLHRYFRVLALKPFGEKSPPLESDWSPINWETEATASPEISTMAGPRLAG